MGNFLSHYIGEFSISNGSKVKYLFTSKWLWVRFPLQSQNEILKQRKQRP